MAVPYTFGSATTSIPLSQLDSNFATAITLGNTAVQLGNTITTLTGVSNVASATSLSLGSNGNTTAVTIDTSQNVGIGTSSPAKKLDVSGTGRFTGELALGNDINQTTDGYVYSSNGGGGVRAGFFLDGTNQVVKAYTAASERMRIDSSGNVGIGTTSPTSVASGHTVLDIASASGKSTNLYLHGNGTSGGSGGLQIQSSTGDAGIYQNSNLPLLFSTNATERLRINASGQIGVGQNPNGYAQFQVLFDATTTANNTLGIGVSPVANTSGAIYVRFYNATGNECGSITRVGTTNAVTYGTTSDYRLKENVQPMTGALAKVALLKPVTYIWKDCKEPAEGFIAHELQEVIPTAVSGVKDGVDAQGNPKYQNVDASYVVATLTAAIQELKAINDQQAETINALTARIVALEAK